MTRQELMKRLAESATRPLADDMHQPAEDSPPEAASDDDGCTDLFVWFEDTSARYRDGRRGIAGLPESLLPIARGVRTVERRYAEGHMHLLAAVRLRCNDRFSERIAAIYTAALSVGTIAWIGTGRQYNEAWREMYPYGGQAA